MPSPTLAKVEAHVFRAPIQEPVRTSFGTMAERVAVFVKVEDSDGARGWGEIWSNFSTASAEHRALLFVPDGAEARRVRLGLDRGTFAGRPADGRMDASRRRRPDPACRRREFAQCWRLPGSHRFGPFRGHPARCRQMGRPFGLPAGGAGGAGSRPQLLPGPGLLEVD